MNAEQVIPYLGCEWHMEGNGPDKWNCWNFLRHLLREYFDANLPEAHLGNPVELRDIYEGKLRSGDWTIIPHPVHGSGVLLKEGMHPHVGLYLDIDGGGVLHAMEGHGVIFTPINALRMLGFGRVKYYEIRKHDNSHSSERSI